MNRKQFILGSAAAFVPPRWGRVSDQQDWAKTLFVMDTWFWQEKALTISEQCALLKKIGYGGMALSWGQKHDERLAVLKEYGLKTPGCFITVDIDDSIYPEALQQCVALMKGTGGRVWLALASKKNRRSDPAGDRAALKIVNTCADACKAAGMPGIALYPHVDLWQERVRDAIRICKKARRPDVGMQFNQYHWMVADGGKDLRKTLKAALPYLHGVSVNGSGKVPSILPLSEGEFDVLPILRTLHELRYAGPVSHQGYSIEGNLPARLAAAKETWESLKARAQQSR